MRPAGSCREGTRSAANRTAKIPHLLGLDERICHAQAARRQRRAERFFQQDIGPGLPSRLAAGYGYHYRASAGGQSAGLSQQPLATLQVTIHNKGICPAPGHAADSLLRAAVMP